MPIEHLFTTSVHPSTPINVYLSQRDGDGCVLDVGLRAMWVDGSNIRRK